MEPKRGAKWDQGATKRGTIRHLKRDPQKNTTIELKCSQNGANMDLKWSPNGVKL